MSTTGRRGWWPTSPLLGDKMALVVGGGRGIGEQTSRMLASAGATVAVLDVEPDRAERVAKEIREDGDNAIPIVADLRVEDDVARAVADVASELGRIDVLANVAGGMSAFGKWQHLEEWTTDDWDMIVHINLRYHFWICRAVIPLMRESGGGTIVNVTSISGVWGAPNHSAYGAAKAGLIQLTKTLAVENGHDHIRVNAVSPGSVVTPAVQGAGRMTEDHQKLVANNLPLGRPQMPEDIARAILFFASPMSEQITGQMICVDGGSGSKFPNMLRGSEPWESARFT